MSKLRVHWISIVVSVNQWIAFRDAFNIITELPDRDMHSKHPGPLSADDWYCSSKWLLIAWHLGMEEGIPRYLELVDIRVLNLVVPHMPVGRQARIHELAHRVIRRKVHWPHRRGQVWLPCRRVLHMFDNRDGGCCLWHGYGYGDGYGLVHGCGNLRLRIVIGIRSGYSGYSGHSGRDCAWLCVWHIGPLEGIVCATR